MERTREEDEDANVRYQQYPNCLTRSREVEDGVSGRRTEKYDDAQFIEAMGWTERLLLVVAELRGMPNLDPGIHLNVPPLVRP